MKTIFKPPVDTGDLAGDVGLEILFISVGLMLMRGLFFALLLRGLLLAVSRFLVAGDTGDGVWS